MNLREAILNVLKQYGGVLTAEEIIRQIIEQNLYMRGSGTYPEYSQLLMRLKNHPEYFEVIVRLKK